VARQAASNAARHTIGKAYGELVNNARVLFGNALYNWYYQSVHSLPLLYYQYNTSYFIVNTATCNSNGELNFGYYAYIQTPQGVIPLWRKRTLKIE